MVELTKRLKLSLINQILISLSLVESCRDENQPEGKHRLNFTKTWFCSFENPEAKTS